MRKTCLDRGHRWGKHVYFGDEQFIRRCQRAGCGRFLCDWGRLGHANTYDQDPIDGRPINVHITRTATRATREVLSVLP